MTDRFCPYCRIFKPDEGFKTILHTSSNTRRGMCPQCQERRKLPRSVLQELADRDKQARKKPTTRQEPA